jgi:succinate dehydrogenase hydrophobic anchor subunit
MEISLDYIQKEEAAIAIVLIFTLGFVGVILLVEVVLWRVGVLLSSEPL